MATDSYVLSKVLSHALRHEPWLYELELDDEGWVDLDVLVDSLRRDPRFPELTPPEVHAVIGKGSKPRHEIQSGRVRARYGHSFSRRVSFEPAGPPPLLFHATSPDALQSIQVEGLRPMGRQYVHLSADVATARRVGLRKASNPAILRVDAQGASNAGLKFYPGNQEVWLADHIPPMYLHAPGSY